MWRVATGKLKIKIDECRDDTPEAIVELIRQCTEFDRKLRPNFAPEVSIGMKNICLKSFLSIRLMTFYRNLNLSFHVFNVRNRNHV